MASKTGVMLKNREQKHGVELQSHLLSTANQGVRKKSRQLKDETYIQPDWLIFPVSKFFKPLRARFDCIERQENHISKWGPSPFGHRRRCAACSDGAVDLRVCWGRRSGLTCRRSRPCSLRPRPTPATLTTRPSPSSGTSRNTSRLALPWRSASTRPMPGSPGPGEPSPHGSSSSRHGSSSSPPPSAVPSTARQRPHAQATRHHSV